MNGAERFWVWPDDLDRLFSAKRLCYMIPPSTSKCAFGSLLDLLSVRNRIRSVGRDILPVAVLDAVHALRYEDVRSAQPSRLGGTVFLYRLGTKASKPGALELRSLGFVGVQYPPLTYAHVVVYRSDEQSESRHGLKDVMAWLSEGGSSSVLASTPTPFVTSPNPAAVIVADLEASGRRSPSAGRTPFVANIGVDGFSQSTAKHARTALLELGSRIDEGLEVNLLVEPDHQQDPRLKTLTSQLERTGMAVRTINCLNELDDGLRALREGGFTLAQSGALAKASLGAGVATVVLGKEPRLSRANSAERHARDLAVRVSADDPELVETLMQLVRRRRRRSSSQLAAQDAVSTSEAQARLLLSEHLSREYARFVELRLAESSDRAHTALLELSELRFEYGRLLNAVSVHRDESRTTHPASTKEPKGYGDMLQGVKEVVMQVVPEGEIVLVVSRGDNRLLQFERRMGWHFPRTQAGVYSGHHPEDSAEAIEHLEQLRRQGADYLLVPATSYWWLEHYKGFREHLEQHYSVRLIRAPVCLLFNLHARPGPKVARSERLQQIVHPEPRQAGATHAPSQRASPMPGQGDPPSVKPPGGPQAVQQPQGNEPLPPPLSQLDEEKLADHAGFRRLLRQIAHPVRRD